MNIPDYVGEIMQARQTGTQTTGSWFAKLRPLFYDKFGPDWRDHTDAFVLDFEKIDHILVPTDFSAYSCEAFPWENGSDEFAPGRHGRKNHPAGALSRLFRKAEGRASGPVATDC